METSLYRDKVVGIYGLAKSGISTYKALSQNVSKIVAWDDNKASRIDFINKISYFTSSKKTKALLQDISAEIWQNIDVLILSPGIATDFPYPHQIVKLAREKNIEIICDIELLYRANPFAKFVAITGTNGKSTTTSLISHILKENNIESDVGGNIGIPALSLKKLRSGGIYTIETSSFQLELTKKFKPKISILLNLTPDHLDRYKNIDSYIAAKMKIFANQNQEDIAIIGIDCDITKKIYEKLLNSRKLAKVIPFSTEQILEKGAFAQERKIYYNFDDRFEINIPNNKFLIGNHNKENMLAAIIACYLLGIDKDKIEKVLQNFVGLSHRMEFLGEKNGLVFINDSKATNPESAAKSLQSFENIHWIVGGYPKGEFKTEILEPLYKNIKKAYLIGKSSKILEKLLANKLVYENCNNLNQAFKLATLEAKKGDVILLAPSFASFDQFKNYIHRGECFRNLYMNY